jgi:hypothetical protein
VVIQRQSKANPRSSTVGECSVFTYSIPFFSHSPPSTTMVAPVM